MKRRYTVILEVAILLGLCVWLGVWAMRRGHDAPPQSIDIKMQLRGADDRVYVFRDTDGQLRYRLTHRHGKIEDLTPQDFTERLYKDRRSRAWSQVLLNISGPMGYVWVAVGLLGQVLFTGRMVVQWLVSEKEKKSVVPPVFWWMSLIGSTMLLMYFVWRQDPVGVLGQAVGWFIYVRNLVLIYTGEPKETKPVATAEPAK